MPAHEPRYDIELRPQLTDTRGRPHHGPPLRRARVAATGETGASGYPHYAGDGVSADIDPATGSVESITVDGEELPYGWVAQLADPEDRDGGDGDATKPEGTRL